MIKRNTLFALLVIAFYPLFVGGVLSDVFNTPFGPETVTRFIIPFQFQGNANIAWTVMESTQWDIFRPVYSLSVLSDYVLWGTNARMYHITDLLLSWLCYTLVFFLLKRQFGFMTAALTVLFWAVHPAQPMSLLKILGRNDRLVTLFSVAALYTYDSSFGEKTHRRFLYLLTLLFVILAVLSKDTGIFYALILPGWSILAKGRSIKETVFFDRFLWLGLVVLGTLFVSLRHLAEFSITIDAGELNLGFKYFQGLAILILKGLPLPHGLTLNPIAVCSFSLMVVVTAVLWRKCPKPVRFAVFAFGVFIFPFPFFWTQNTFLWGFWIWASLALAGSTVFIFNKVIKQRNMTVRILSITAIVSILALSSLWSARVADEISAPLIEKHEIARFAISAGCGPVYSREMIFAGFPDWAVEMEGFSAEEYRKKTNYIVGLIQLETGNPASTVR